MQDQAGVVKRAYLDTPRPLVWLRDHLSCPRKLWGKATAALDNHDAKMRRKAIDNAPDVVHVDDYKAVVYGMATIHREAVNYLTNPRRTLADADATIARMREVVEGCDE